MKLRTIVFCGMFFVFVILLLWQAGRGQEGLRDSLESEFAELWWSPDSDCSCQSLLNMYFRRYLNCMTGGGQEECIRWIKPGKGAAFYFWVDGHGIYPDSVGIPVGCPDTASGAWYWELYIESLDFYLRIRADTLWEIGDSVWIENPLPYLKEAK